MQHDFQAASVQLPHWLACPMIAGRPSLSAPQPTCSPAGPHHPCIRSCRHACGGTPSGTMRKRLSRLRWQEGVYDAFVEAMVAAVKKLKMGGGMDSTTTLGPLISTGAVERVGPWQPGSICHPGLPAWSSAALEPPGRILP